MIISLVPLRCCVLLWELCEHVEALAMAMVRVHDDCGEHGMAECVRAPFKLMSDARACVHV